jgi:hypothetical protein
MGSSAHLSERLARAQLFPLLPTEACTQGNEPVLSVVGPTEQTC